MSNVVLRNIRQVSIWTPRRHSRRWRSWGRWKRWLYLLRRWQPSSRPVYPASSAAFNFRLLHLSSHSLHCRPSNATAPGLGWCIASDICPPFQTWKDFSSQNCRQIFKQFRRRRFGTQPTKALLIPTVTRRWDTPSLYGTQQDGAFMGTLHQISSTTVSSLVVKLRRGACVTCGAAQARRAAQERALACKAHSWCPANIITQKCCFYAKTTELRETTDFTQK